MGGMVVELRFAVYLTGGRCVVCLVVCMLYESC